MWHRLRMLQKVQSCLLIKNITSKIYVKWQLHSWKMWKFPYVALGSCTALHQEMFKRREVAYPACALCYFYSAVFARTATGSMSQWNASYSRAKVSHFIPQMELSVMERNKIGIIRVSIRHAIFSTSCRLKYRHLFNKCSLVFTRDYDCRIGKWT